MSDPKYLTEEGGDATDLERELLLAAQGAFGLTPSEKQTIWVALAQQAMPAPAGGTVAPGTAAKAGASVAPWLKGFLLLCGLGGISAGIFGLRHGARQTAAAPSAAASLRAIAAPPTPSALAASDSQATPSEVTSARADGSSAASSASAPSAPGLSKSALREESLAVLQIRSALRAGDANGALRLLDQARQRFPHGALSQEREALSIEALAKSGARDAAARQAEAFLRAHPKSPYAADVQSVESR